MVVEQAAIIVNSIWIQESLIEQWETPTTDILSFGPIAFCTVRETFPESVEVSETVERINRVVNLPTGPYLRPFQAT